MIRRAPQRVNQRVNKGSFSAPNRDAARLVFEDDAGRHERVPDAVGFRPVLGLARIEASRDLRVDLRVAETRQLRGAGSLVRAGGGGRASQELARLLAEESQHSA